MFRLPKQIYLWMAVLIFGASNSITRKLTDIGAQSFVDGQNPVSFCNILFVGNLCALLLLLLIYWRQWNLSALKQISKQTWLSLVAVAILSGAIAPGLIFQALSSANVNNVVLIGRLQPPVALLLSVYFLKERVNRWDIIGAIVSFLGVVLAFLLQPMQLMSASIEGEMSLGSGEVLTAIAAIAMAISTVLAKAKLSQIPLGIYSVFRTALGTLVFFVLALLVYGADHFSELASPFLWKWMLIYGPLIVVVGQSFWIAGLKVSTVSTASLVSSFTPVASIVMAYLILGEVPTAAQYIGGSVIILGIGLSLGGQMRHVTRPRKPITMTEAQTMEDSMGFKGI